MKNVILILFFGLLAFGCSPKIQTDANGVPQFTIAADDLASSIEIVTNGIFETEGKVATVTFTKKDMPGMTGLRFKLTAAKRRELGKFRHYVVIRTLNMNGQPDSAHAQILVGSKVVYDNPDFRGFMWSADGEMALDFKSPEDAQWVVDTLTKKQ